MSKYESPMKYVILFVRMFSGGHFAFSGLNHFFQFVPEANPPSGVSHDYVSILMQMGMFDVVKVIESLVGICLLFNLFVPLIIVVGFPVTFNVFYNNVFVDPHPHQIMTGIRGLLSDIFLLAAYARYYLPLTTFKAAPQPIWTLWRSGALKIANGALTAVEPIERRA